MSTQAMTNTNNKTQNVTLKELKGWREWLPLGRIRVKPEQRKHTSNIIVTYLQSTHPAVTTFAIYKQDDVIGYVMLIHAENPAQWIIERLTIDGNYQRQGYGYEVADQLIDMVYDMENSEMVIARYDTDNDVARELFAKLKFEQQDKLVRGRNIALLEFEFEEPDDDEDDEDDEDDTDVSEIDTEESEETSPELDETDERAESGTTNEEDKT